MIRKLRIASRAILLGVDSSSGAAMGSRCHACNRSRGTLRRRKPVRGEENLSAVYDAQVPWSGEVGEGGLVVKVKVGVAGVSGTTAVVGVEVVGTERVPRGVLGVMGVRARLRVRALGTNGVDCKVEDVLPILLVLVFLVEGKSIELAIWVANASGSSRGCVRASSAEAQGFLRRLPEPS